MFVGVYSSQIVGPSPPDQTDVLRGGVKNDIPYDDYRLELLGALGDLSGRLHIDWPQGRNWKRLGEAFGYKVREIRLQEADPPYPGHSAFFEKLSLVEVLPETWRSILQNAKGVYVLTCPRDKAHYVGKADGEGGFYARWLSHAYHGGDAIGFRQREPSEYRVGILEVAGSFASSRDIDQMEGRWKQKLQSRAIGINKN